MQQIKKLLSKSYVFFQQQVIQLVCACSARDTEHYCTGMWYETDRSVILEDTDIAFLRQWCCDITNDFVSDSDQDFVWQIRWG